MLLSSLNSCTNPWIYMAFSNALSPFCMENIQVSGVNIPGFSGEQRHQDHSFTDCEENHPQYRMSQFTKVIKQSLDEGTQGVHTEDTFRNPVDSMSTVTSPKYHPNRNVHLHNGVITK